MLTLKFYWPLLCSPQLTVLFNSVWLLSSLSFHLFLSVEKVAATFNLFEALVKNIVLGLECNGVSFFLVGKMLVTYLSMKSVLITMFINNVSTALNAYLVCMSPCLMKSLLCPKKMILWFLAERKFRLYSFLTSLIYKYERKIVVTKFGSVPRCKGSWLYTRRLDFLSLIRVDIKQLFSLLRF